MEKKDDLRDLKSKLQDLKSKLRNFRKIYNILKHSNKTNNINYCLYNAHNQIQNQIDIIDSEKNLDKLNKEMVEKVQSQIKFFDEERIKEKFNNNPGIQKQLSTFFSGSSYNKS